MTLVDRFKHGVDVTKFKADQLMRINRIQGEIDSLQQNISRLYNKIAVTTVELHKKDVLANSELVDLCVAIDRLDESILEKRKNIAAIREEEAPQFASLTVGRGPINPCPQCNSDVPIGAEYCPNCGNRMPTIESPSNIDSVAPGIVCSECGTRTPDGAEFCPQCGKPLDLQNQQ